MFELWILWSSNFTNLLFLLLSEDTLRSGRILSVFVAGDKLPARVLSTFNFTCRGLTGDGVAKSRGTCGGGTSSDTFPANPRGIGREDGRVTWLETRGLSGMIHVGKELFPGFQLSPILSFYLMILNPEHLCGGSSRVILCHCILTTKM